jgi:uncharacterized membrane protein YfcA
MTLLTVLIVGVAALGVSALTLFSGFGLGTLLMPVFALFFPVEVAVAATAVVHGLNNLFKVYLLHRDVVSRVLLRFGLPAVLAAFLGARLLAALSVRPPIFEWYLGDRVFLVTPIKAAMGGLILVFALFELLPHLRALRAPTRWLPLGGALSGFFGGLSGHQGALRAAFLGPLELRPAAFAATQAVLATMVDAARLAVYGLGFFAGRMAGLSTRSEWLLVGFASLCAFAGALIGKRLLHRVTVAWVRRLTGTLLLIVGLGLTTGLL